MTELHNLLKVNLASKMAAKSLFQPNLEFTSCIVLLLFNFQLVLQTIVINVPFEPPPLPPPDEIYNFYNPAPQSQ